MDIKKNIVETTEYKQLQDVSLYQDVCHIIEQGRERAYNAVSQQMVETYWNIGRRIVEEEQQGKERAEYGEQIIEKLSKQLTLRYGRGFGKRYLAYFRQFYLTINNKQILQTCLQNLTWSHILRALRVDDPIAIRWYLTNHHMCKDKANHHVHGLNQQPHVQGRAESPMVFIAQGKA